MKSVYILNYPKCVYDLGFDMVAIDLYIYIYKYICVCVCVQTAVAPCFCSVIKLQFNLWMVKMSKSFVSISLWYWSNTHRNDKKMSADVDVIITVPITEPLWGSSLHKGSIMWICNVFCVTVNKNARSWLRDNAMTCAHFSHYWAFVRDCLHKGSTTWNCDVFEVVSLNKLWI